MLRLGDDVARDGRISAPTADRAVASVRRLRQLADALGRAGGDRQGHERDPHRRERQRARRPHRGRDRRRGRGDQRRSRRRGSIFAAIRASVVLEPAPALCFDLGGGSVEIMVGDAAGLRWATSVPLGVGRLTAELVHADPPSQADRKRARRARSAPGSTRSSTRCAAAQPRMAVGTSGTINDLARMAVALRSGDGDDARERERARASRATDSTRCTQRIVRMRRRRSGGGCPGIEEQARRAAPRGRRRCSSPRSSCSSSTA